MASESRLYTFSDYTKSHLKKFRLETSRCKTPRAVIYKINSSTQEIKWDEEEGEVYQSLLSMEMDLPEDSPRFILLSYPMTLPSGRTSVPYVMLYYLPVTCNPEQKMLYAGAKELMRNTAQVGKVLDIESTDDLRNVPEMLIDIVGDL